MEKIKTLAEREAEAIVEAVQVFSGKKLRAAKALGIGKTTLYRKIKEYGLEDRLNR